MEPFCGSPPPDPRDAPNVKGSDPGLERLESGVTPEARPPSGGEPRSSRDRKLPRRRFCACEGGAAAAGLLDEQTDQRGVVPELEPDFGGDLDCALREEAVLPEVAEATGCPGAFGELPPSPTGMLPRRRGRDDRVLPAARPPETWICRPSATAAAGAVHAPEPRAAHQRRPRAGAETTATWHTTPTLEGEQRRPDGNSAHVVLRPVDRVDDPTHPHHRRPRAPRRTLPRPDRSRATRARIASSAARSASETGVRSGFVSTRRSQRAEAPQRDRVRRVSPVRARRDRSGFTAATVVAIATLDLLRAVLATLDPRDRHPRAACGLCEAEQGARHTAGARSDRPLVRPAAAQFPVKRPEGPH